MRKTILSLLLALFSLCFESDATNHYTMNHDRYMLVVQTTPKIMLYRESNTFYLDGIKKNDEVKLSEKKYKGIIMSQILNIDKSMDKKEIQSKLELCFGKKVDILLIDEDSNPELVSRKTVYKK